MVSWGSMAECVLIELVLTTSIICLVRGGRYRKEKLSQLRRVGQGALSKSAADRDGFYMPYVRKFGGSRSFAESPTRFDWHPVKTSSNKSDRTGHQKYDLQNRPQFQISIDGGWSEWQPWSDCQTTCGSGSRVRERWCNKPTPTSDGKDCQGPSTEKEPCKLKVHCPQNGGWGKWTPWSCSVTCGGGVASRSRLCDSPPAIYGGICVGNETEIRNSSCNEFTCLQTRKIGNETRKILQNISRDFHVKENIVPEGTSIAKILCGTKELLDNLLWELKMDFPRALNWVKNGQPWKEDTSRINKATTLLDFKRVAANDTGFYSCELDLLGGGRKIVKAFSLIVNSNKTNLEVELGQPFELDCNSMVLGTIYPNARLSWYFNDVLYQSFNETPATLTSTMKFPFATLNLTGQWECRTYELAIRHDQGTKKKKGVLEKVKNKIFESEKEEEEEEEGKAKKGPAILQPLFKFISTPAPLPQLVEGRIWVTNRLRIRVNPPKSISEMLRTPQFLGLCVGVAFLGIVVAIGLVQSKASDMMDNAQGNLKKMGDKQQVEPKSKRPDIG